MGLFSNIKRFVNKYLELKESKELKSARLCPDKCEPPVQETGDTIYAQVKQQIDLLIGLVDIDDIIESFDTSLAVYKKSWGSNMLRMRDKSYRPKDGHYVSLAELIESTSGYCNDSLSYEYWLDIHKKISEIGENLKNNPIKHNKATRTVNIATSKVHNLLMRLATLDSYPAYNVSPTGGIEITNTSDWSKAHFLP